MEDSVNKIKERALSLCAEYENRISELRNIYKTKCTSEATRHFSCAIHARAGTIEKCENTYCMIEQISAWSKNICRWISSGLWAGSESKQSEEDRANEVIPLAQSDYSTLFQVLDQRVRRILASVDVEVRALRGRSRISAFFHDHSLAIAILIAIKVILIIFIIIITTNSRVNAKKQETAQASQAL